MASSAIYKPLEPTRKSEEFDEKDKSVAFLRDPSRRRSKLLDWCLGLFCLASLSFNVFFLVHSQIVFKAHDEELALSKYGT